MSFHNIAMMGSDRDSLIFRRHSNMLLFRLLKRAISIALLLLLPVGIFGYVLIERWPALDSPCMTIITLPRWVYGGTSLTQEGRIFAIFLIFLETGVYGFNPEADRVPSTGDLVTPTVDITSLIKRSYISW